MNSWKTWASMITFPVEKWEKKVKDKCLGCDWGNCKDHNAPKLLLGIQRDILKYQEAMEKNWGLKKECRNVIRLTGTKNWPYKNAGEKSSEGASAGSQLLESSCIAFWFIFLHRPIIVGENTSLEHLHYHNSHHSAQQSELNFH